MRMLRFQPIYQERVWGGRGLEDKLGRALPDQTRPFGESWEIVDRDEANSTITDGPHAGKSLREALRSDALALMGPGWDGEKPFPLLVKWLDCRERLSLQVHPPARVAGELGGEPKTENWYIADAEPDAALIVGLKRGVSREQFEKALREERLEDCLHRFTVEPGQSVFVPSGRLHAIDAGNLILEIQQNSDTTYRVYDWGRTGLDGKPRELHLEQSLKSIDWGDEEPRPIPAGGTETVLADAEPFRLTRRALDPRESLAFAANEQPHVLSVVSGALEETSDGPLRRGENVLLPFAEAFTFTATEPATVLITDRFSGPAT